MVSAYSILLDNVEISSNLLNESSFRMNEYTTSIVNLDWT